MRTVAKYAGSGSAEGAWLFDLWNDSGTYRHRLQFYSSGAWRNGWYSVAVPPTVGEWEYYAATMNGTVARNFIGGERKQETSTPYSIPSYNKTVRIGEDNPQGTGAEWFNGKIQEVRISSVARSDGWAIGSNYSIKDDLITYTGADIYQVTGYVKQQDVPVQRTLYIYDRTSGELMGKTQSNPSTGYYSVTTTASGMHHVVALDDVTDIYDYNDLIISKVYPTKVI
jgi:hypothetical protein